MSERAAETQVRQPAKPAAPTGRGAVLQRACACGKHEGNGGECAECRKKRLGLQRRAVGQGPDVAPPIVHEVLRSPGRPLDDQTRGFMESRFGHDFSRVPATGPRMATAGLAVGPTDDPYEREAERQAWRVMNNPATTARISSPSGPDFSRVRVHTNAKAAESAHAVNALAFTVGQEVVFGAGQYSPATTRGRQLIAHELAHVVQQSGANGVNLQSFGKDSPSPISQPDMISTVDTRVPYSHVSTGAEGVLQRTGKPRSVDTPADVLEAIVNIMSVIDMFYTGNSFDVPEMHPLYYIKVKKNVTKKEHIDLLWSWFQITNGTVTDKRGIQFIVKGSMARAHIRQAVHETVPIIEGVLGKQRDRAELIARYAELVEKLTQRAVREEVDEMLEAGLAAERQAVPSLHTMAEEKSIRAGASSAIETLNKIAATARRLTRGFGSSELNQDYYNHFHKWIAQMSKEEIPLIPEPVKPVLKMNVADGIRWLKGGLDLVNSILWITDPRSRQKLFEARSSYWGKVTQGLDINKTLWQFVSGAIAISGASVYGLAKVLGNARLAAQMLTVSTEWVGHVAATLSFVGIAHGAAVLLDSEASADEKAAAIVEVASGSISVAGYASRWTPRLAGVARWSGPIGASLFINYYGLKYFAKLHAGAVAGLSAQDWVYCRKATTSVAEEVQGMGKKLAVINELLAFETDVPRLHQLEKYADAIRWSLLEVDIKPYLKSRGLLGSYESGRDVCGAEYTLCSTAFTNRFKPLLPLLADGEKKNDAALYVAATFLDIVSTAYADWRQIVTARC